MAIYLYAQAVFLSIIIFICCLGIPSLADEIILKNGNRISGDIVQKSAENLSDICLP